MSDFYIQLYKALNKKSEGRDLTFNESYILFVAEKFAKLHAPACMCAPYAQRCGVRIINSRQDG